MESKGKDMYISQTAAQSIVEEIGREINEHINFMDQEGYIVASTDMARLGTLHTGARRIIEEKLPELYITEEMENPTTRLGINLPITIRGEIVGVVGITGEKERVAGYGNIVRRMTEIMVEDSRMKDHRKYDRRVRYRFMEEWIARSGAYYDRNFVERGIQIGIDIMRPRRAMVIHFARYSKLSATQEGQRKLEEMESAVRHYVDREGVLYLREPLKQICLTAACDDESIRKLAEHIRKLLWDKYEERIIIGIDSVNGGSLHISQLCKEAERAAEAGRQDEIVFYKDLYVELFLHDISDDVRAEYLEKLFPGVREEELDAYMKLIDVFFEEDGSLARMSDKLYMHKNTIQYKLKKMEALNGLDIRTPSGAAVYYMALQFYQNAGNDMPSLLRNL